MTLIPLEKWRRAENKTNAIRIAHLFFRLDQKANCGDFGKKDNLMKTAMEE